MKQFRCFFKDCTNLPRYSCTCESPPVVICNKHLRNHFEHAVSHSLELSSRSFERARDEANADERKADALQNRVAHPKRTPRALIKPDRGEIPGIPNPLPDIQSSVRQMKQRFQWPTHFALKRLIAMMDNHEKIRIVAILKKLEVLGINLDAMTDTLFMVSGDIPVYLVYKLFVEAFANRGIECVAATQSLDSGERAALLDLHKQWMTLFAFSALKSKLIPLDSEPYNKLSRTEFMNTALWSPFSFYTCGCLELQRDSARFIDSGLSSYIVAECLVEELDRIYIGSFKPMSLFNLHTLATAEQARRFILQMTENQCHHYELLLRDILKQSRRRNNCSQASGNATTLLLQMECEFSRKDYTELNLTGVHLVRANFRDTDLYRDPLTEYMKAERSMTHPDLRHAYDKTGSRCSIKVRALCFAGALVASGMNNHTVIIWNILHGTQVTTLNGHPETVESVCFSLDCTLIAAGGLKRTIVLWEIKTSSQLLVITTHGMCVYTVSFSPDGKHLASGSTDGIVAVWAIPSGKQEDVFENPYSSDTDEYISRHGAELAFGRESERVKAAVSGRLQTFKCESWPATVSFVSNDTLVAANYYDSSVVLWTLNQGPDTRPMRGYFPQEGPFRVFSTGLLTITVCRAGIVKVWDSVTGHLVCRIPVQIPDIYLVCSSPDSSRIIICDRKKRLTMWEIPEVMRASNLIRKL